MAPPHQPSHPVPPRPERRTARLLLGRVSAAGATYFLTLCTADRAAALLEPPALSAIRSALGATFTATDAPLHAACVMSDHVHLLFRLGPRLSVGQVMGKFKSHARRACAAAWSWQLNGYEHRLREHEREEDYAFYVFMNPYRAGLVPMTRPWPAWICPEPRRYRFLDALAPDGSPPAEWLVLP
jgi:REP element-mobilizing transposase RayT